MSRDLYSMKFLRWLSIDEDIGMHSSYVYVERVIAFASMFSISRPAVALVCGCLLLPRGSSSSILRSSPLNAAQCWEFRAKAYFICRLPGRILSIFVEFVLEEFHWLCFFVFSVSWLLLIISLHWENYRLSRNSNSCLFFFYFESTNFFKGTKSCIFFFGHW